MDTMEQNRIDQFDLDAIVNQPTNEQAISELENQILGLRYNLSDKVRQAITNHGLRITDLSMQIGLSYSGMSQILSNAFNMSIDTMDAFIKRLFPGKSVDEVFFGISRPTRIPMIPNLFLNARRSLSSPFRSPVKLSTTSTMCSMVFGPAMSPDLFMWATMNTGTPSALPYCINRFEQALIWVMLPAILSRSWVYIV